jgi:hypothetical protein
LLDETKKKFVSNATPAEPAGEVTTAGATIYVLGFSTSNYDAMIKFLRDFGFAVAENPDQLTPFFEHGRASRVTRGNLDFNLEESQSPDDRARFNLWIAGSTEEEIARLKALGYECKDEVSPYGEFHIFRTPDGGTFIL